MIFIISFLVVILDQFTKFLAIKHLKGAAANILIEDVFQFTYVENYGAAFGILENKKILFVIITLVVSIAIAGFLIKHYKSLSNFLRVALVLYLGGSIGNLIDRIRYGYVVDFISVKLFNSYDFPVFNVADIFIVVGTIMIVLLLLFEKEKA